MREALWPNVVTDGKEKMRAEEIHPVNQFLKKESFYLNQDNRPKDRLLKLIMKTGDKCISTPCLSLLPDEVAVLGSAL